jgi:VWFA-related protein
LKLTSPIFLSRQSTNRSAFLTTLQEGDIRVLEDGVPQQLFTFQRESDRPLALAFLIDVSASEERTLPAEKAAARSFIETVIQSRKDQAAIIPFTGLAFLEQPLTRDMLGIYRALERVEVALPAYLGSGRPLTGIVAGPGTRRMPREGTYCNLDAIALTATEVLGQTSEQGQEHRRRAIILLTDGQDTSSILDIGQAIDRALWAETVIYAIGIGDNKYEASIRYMRTVAERNRRPRLLSEEGRRPEKGLRGD